MIKAAAGFAFLLGALMMVIGFAGLFMGITRHDDALLIAGAILVGAALVKK
ncbi:hypothetical protein BH09SUM1_BH09SUM1_30800 [soil metagenome]